MNICFVVNGRSPIAHNWIGYLLDEGHDVHVISSAAVASFDERLRSWHVVPLGLGRVVETVRSTGRLTSAGPSVLRRCARVASYSISALRPLLASVDVYRHTDSVRAALKMIKPDLVHAMRIPFEGIATAEATLDLDVPLLVSVWGNDFTYYAARFSRVRRMTRRALQRIDAIHPDCERDRRLAGELGFDRDKPSIVLPGGGGIQPNVFFDGPASAKLRDRLGLRSDAVVIFNPRGMRPYVRNKEFFVAARLVLNRCPKAAFLCADLAGHPVAQRWMASNGLTESMRLLDGMPRTLMADLFRLADITVSPSDHDGTPNTLLEGMACGAFPIAGALESVAEWITPGVNGLFCDPSDPTDLARAMIQAIEDPNLRASAATENQKVVANWALHDRVMHSALAFYQELVSGYSAPGARRKR